MPNSSTVAAQQPSAPPASPAAPAAKRGLRRQWVTFALAVGTAVGSACLAWLLAATPLLQLFELKTLDLRFVLRGKEPPPRDIVLVLMDDRTELAIPDPRIFWQPYFAALFRGLAASGARTIGLDVSFAIPVEKWAPDADRQLAAAFAEVSASVPIILAYDNLQSLQAGLPLYMLATTQGAIGYANLALDQDGAVRRAELQTRDENAYESFAARLAAVTLHIDRGVADRQHNVIRFGSRTVPLDHTGYLPIHYYGPSRTFASVSMVDAIATAQNGDTAQMERWFKDKIVLVGTTDPSDKKATPFFLAAGSDKLMPGVEVQANTLATLLEQRYLRESPRWVALVLVCASAGLAAFIIFLIRFPTGPLLMIALFTGYVGLSVLFLRQGLIVPVVPPALSLIISGFASYGAYSLTEGRKRRLLQDVFGRYVSKEIAQELLSYGDIPLGGEKHVVTVMFTDLRNFTSYCQGRDPQLVVAELNEYFSDMTTEIKRHGGMVNKFIGDGIMALFGAPVPHPNDAHRAVACGIQMVRRNDAFNKSRAEHGLAPLVVGVGLHTGEAVVGTIGAPEKMEYTAIGDTVNIASRIESENKTFHCKLLASEATYEYVRDKVVAELAGHASLKGIAEPVPLYKILSLKGDETWVTEH